MNYRLTILVAALTFSFISCSKTSSSTNTQATGNPPSRAQAPSNGDKQGSQKPSSQKIDFRGFSVIREFGSNDTAAIFGLLPSSGAVKLTSISGPVFLQAARVGILDQGAMDHLFLKSAKPMSQQEKQQLISQWAGAHVIYFEGYNGNLCTNSETENELTVSGTVDETPFTATYRFIALPSTTGDCAFHIFAIFSHL